MINDYFLGSTKITSLDLSPLKNVTKIGKKFLSCCNLSSVNLSGLSKIKEIKNNFLSVSYYDKYIDMTFEMNNTLESIDLSPLSNVTCIGNNFICRYSNINTLDLSPLSEVTSIGDGFLAENIGIETLDLSPLSNVTSIGKNFLYRNLNLKKLDFSRLDKLQEIGNYFLERCYKIDSVIFGPNIRHILKNELEKMKFKIIFTDDFKLSDYRHLLFEEITKKQIRVILKFLDMKFLKKDSKKKLISKLKREKKKYEEKYNENDLLECKNEYDLFTAEKIIDIPKKKLIEIENYYFDGIGLKKYLFKFKKANYSNPFTTNEIKDEDIDKILKMNVK